MENQLMEAPQPKAGLVEIASTRSAQEVQAAIVIAQKFPRDEMRAYQKVLDACKRKSLAEKAVYAYPRGDQKVTGPSIRLAETIAKAWGNLDFGLIELEKKVNERTGYGESVMQSYCWDLETNVRSTKIFTVVHKRDTKKGSYKLTDERDIYEIAANNGARRLRSCILAVLPADVVEDAVDACRTTVKSNIKNMTDTVRKMVSAFKDIGVTQEMIEERLGYEIDKITQDDVVDFQSIFNSLKDGTAERSDFFKLGSDDKKESQQQDVQAEQKVEPKSIKKTVKNYAPQTKEEAEKFQSEQAQKSNQEPAKQETTFEEPKTEPREVVIAKLNSLRNDLKMSEQDFFTDCRRVLQKKDNKFSTEELSKLVEYYTNQKGQK